jgi:hypothetical protein
MVRCQRGEFWPSLAGDTRGGGGLHRQSRSTRAWPVGARERQKHYGTARTGSMGYFRLLALNANACTIDLSDQRTEPLLPI